MITVPGDIAVTNPAAETVTTTDAPVAMGAALTTLDAQVTVRPVKAFPATSLRIAASWTLPPIVRPVLRGLTDTVATDAPVPVTVSTMEADTPSQVAVSVATPTPTAVTMPVVVTMARAGSKVVHTIARCGSTRPLLSSVVAVN